jgi:hypothetical protein
MCDDMARDLEEDISCTHCNVQEGVTKRTMYVSFKFPFATESIGKLHLPANI